MVCSTGMMIDHVQSIEVGVRKMSKIVREHVRNAIPSFADETVARHVVMRGEVATRKKKF
jgi:hypothetical protein